MGLLGGWSSGSNQCVSKHQHLPISIPGIGWCLNFISAFSAYLCYLCVVLNPSMFDAEITKVRRERRERVLGCNLPPT
jgi:hypothetical protein